MVGCISPVSSFVAFHDSALRKHKVCHFLGEQVLLAFSDVPVLMKDGPNYVSKPNVSGVFVDAGSSSKGNVVTGKTGDDRGL